MIDIIFLILCVLSLFLVIYFTWMLRCYDTTMKQRFFMIWDHAPDILVDVASVAYEEHLKAVSRFKDPLKLYSPRVQEYFADNWIKK